MEERFRTKEFQNWMKCVSAQIETVKALYGVVELLWKGYISSLTEEERDQIETLVECVECAKIKYLKKDQQPFCDHETCALLLKKLLNLLHNTSLPEEGYASKLPSSDSCYYVYWHIAKLFLTVEVDIVRNGGLKALDISHLSKMMNACQLFAFEGSTETYRTICEDRDELFHTSHYNISDEKRRTILEHLSNVLSHFCNIRLQTCSYVKANIQQNQAKDWLMEYEFGYTKIVRQTLECKIAALELDLHIQESQPLREVLENTVKLHETIGVTLEEEPSQQCDDEMETEGLEDEMEIVKDKIRLLEEEKQDLRKENELQVSKLEKDNCLANTKAFLHCVSSEVYSTFRPQKPLSRKVVYVRSFGNYQDLFVQIEGISILFDPLETDVIERLFLPYKDHWNEKVRNELHSFRLDALVLSTCVNGFNAITVQTILNHSPKVKWITPRGQKNRLVEIGVTESSIQEFDIWEETGILFKNGTRTIKFACTPTNMKQKKCNSCGWIIKGSQKTVYSSGITNYHPSSIFKNVANTFSPIHLALLPARVLSCTNYMATIEETMKIHKRIRAEKTLFISSFPFLPDVEGDNEDSMKSKLIDELMKFEKDKSKFDVLSPTERYPSDKNVPDSYKVEPVQI